MTAKKPKPVERFGPEWYALYAAAWQALWPSARGGTREHTGGAWKIIPVDVSACVQRAVRDADEGTEAFNRCVDLGGKFWEKT